MMNSNKVLHWSALIFCLAFSFEVILSGAWGIFCAIKGPQTNFVRLVIPAILFGLGTGRLIYSLLARNYGNDRMVHFGFMILIVGNVIGMVSDHIILLLIARFVQGLGLVAPFSVIWRTASRYSRLFKRSALLNYFRSLLVFVPIIGVILGFLFWGESEVWMIHLCQMILSFVAWTLFTSLPKSELDFGFHGKSFFKILWRRPFLLHSNAVVVKFTLVACIVGSGLISYLISSQELLGMHYGLGDFFPLLFGFLSIPAGFAFYVGGKLAKKFGKYPLVLAGLFVSACSALTYVIFFCQEQAPSLLVFSYFLMVHFMGIGCVFGNIFTVIPMELGAFISVGGTLVCFSVLITATGLAVMAVDLIIRSGEELFLCFFASSLLSLLILFPWKKLKFNYILNLKT